jgi:predicted MPP superfamily phosphohydrolase
MVRFFPKYDGGLFEENGRKMLLSRGLGMHTIPVRLFNPAELLVLDFAPADSGQSTDR